MAGRAEKRAKEKAKMERKGSWSVMEKGERNF